MLRYGSDKPDLRYGLEIVDVGDIAAQTGVSRSSRERSRAAARSAALNAKGAVDKFSRKELDDLTEFVKRYGAKGLAWVKVEAEKFTRRSRSSCPPRRSKRCASDWTRGRATCCCSSPTRKTWSARSLGTLRTHLATTLKLFDPAKARLQDRLGLRLSRRSSGTTRRSAGRPTITRSPRPMDEDLAMLESDPGNVRAKAYDLVINGYECGGGSIRIHNPEVQSRAVRRAGHDAGAGPAALRLPARRAEVRRPAARRHRPGPGPLGR